MRLFRLVLSMMTLLFLFCAGATAQYTPGGLFSLARAGDIEGLKAQLAQKPNQFLLNSALEAAMIGKQSQAMKLLIEHGADPSYVNPQRTALLVNAIMLGHNDEARLLLESGADADVSGYYRIYQGYTMDWQWTPLMASSYQGDVGLVQLIIDKGADINRQGFSVSAADPETAADIAAYSGHLKVLELLLANGAKLSENIIVKAVRGGHLDVVKLLEKNGADIRQRFGPQQKTLLMEAAWWGHLALVDYLIQRGIDINAADLNGYTALSDAAANGGSEFPDQLKIVKLLVEKGADVRRADDFKLTPLMRAQNPDVIAFLVEAGAR
jgi:ankyrin repeat protein